MAVVLVVDDDPAARKPLARLLIAEGYEVECAADAGVAMAKVLARWPDLILLDVAIPRMDGLTFLWRIRETSAGRGVPVIVISGHEGEEDLRRAQELGVKDYLVKSQFKVRELLELVRRYAGGNSAAAEGVASET
jgi:DNA-binding response OmpR family regulator